VGAAGRGPRAVRRRRARSVDEAAHVLPRGAPGRRCAKRRYRPRLQRSVRRRAAPRTRRRRPWASPPCAPRPSRPGRWRPPLWRVCQGQGGVGARVRSALQFKQGRAHLAGRRPGPGRCPRPCRQSHRQLGRRPGRWPRAWCGCRVGRGVSQECSSSVAFLSAPHLLVATASRALNTSLWRYSTLREYTHVLPWMSSAAGEEGTGCVRQARPARAPTPPRPRLASPAQARTLRKVEVGVAAVKRERQLLQLGQVVRQLCCDVRVPVLGQVPDGSQQVRISRLLALHGAWSPRGGGSVHFCAQKTARRPPLR
jgi:hypothetical protein